MNARAPEHTLVVGLWEIEADPPSVNDAFIHWFEGNVAMGLDGTLYACSAAVVQSAQ